MHGGDDIGVFALYASRVNDYVVSSFNTHNTHKPYTNPTQHISARTCSVIHNLRQLIGFDEEMFIERGGVYQWSKGKMDPASLEW